MGQNLTGPNARFWLAQSEHSPKTVKSARCHDGRLLTVALRQ